MNNSKSEKPIKAMQEVLDWMNAVTRAHKCDGTDCTTCPCAVCLIEQCYDHSPKTWLEEEIAYPDGYGD